MSSRPGTTGPNPPTPEAVGPCPSESSLLAYVQRDGDAGERASLEAHLSRCDDCRTLISALARSSLVDGLGEAPASRAGAPGAPFAPSGGAAPSSRVGEPTSFASAPTSFAGSPGGEAPPPSGPAASTRHPKRAPAEPPPGELVGHYRVERPLGRGGMGVVVAARHEPLGHPVAIKFLLPQAKPSPDLARRFLREARAAAQIASEHVARVLDFGTFGPDDAPYLVMEYLEGQDLAALLKERKRLSVDEAVGYVVQACEAVALAHARGVVHRDLKPANLFLTGKPGGEPLVKVLDFGISKQADPDAGDAGGLTSGGAFLGSPRYMSPEQMVSARDVDQRTDLWALGVILYELLTGQAPFKADTLQGLCVVVSTAQAPWLLDALPGAPEPIARVIKRCLAKAPSERPGDVAELVRVLRPFAPAWALSAAERVERLAPAGEPSEPARASTTPTPSPAAQAPAHDGTEPGHEAPNPARLTRPSTSRTSLAVGLALVLGGALALQIRSAPNQSKADLSAVAPAAQSRLPAPEASGEGPPGGASEASSARGPGGGPSPGETPPLASQVAPTPAPTSAPERLSRDGAPSSAPRGRARAGVKEGPASRPPVVTPAGAAASAPSAAESAFDVMKRRGLTDRKLLARRPRPALPRKQRARRRAERCRPKAGAVALRSRPQDARGRTGRRGVPQVRREPAP